MEGLALLCLRQAKYPHLRGLSRIVCSFTTCSVVLVIFSPVAVEAPTERNLIFIVVLQKGYIWTYLGITEIPSYVFSSDINPMTSHMRDCILNLYRNRGVLCRAEVC